MSFDEIVDLTAGVYFNFYNMSWFRVPGHYCTTAGLCANNTPLQL